jgi:hypothetical protein
MQKFAPYLKISKRSIIVVSVSLFLTGCAVYHPQMTDIPLIDHKNELRIDIGASLIPSVHSTLSYGLTKNIALQAFGSIGIEHRRYLQISPGFYKCLNNSKVIELYSGFGWGYANTIKNPLANMPEAVRQSLYGNYQVYFVQFNWGKKGSQSGGMDWGFGIKTGLFHSNLTDENYYEINSEAGTYPFLNENSILLEPVMLFRTGRKNVKFSYKFGITRIFKLTNQRNYIPAPYINMGFGVNFTTKTNNKTSKIIGNE